MYTGVSRDSRVVSSHQCSPLPQDGLRSAQFEHTLLVTETGCDVLTLRLEEDSKPHFMTSTVKHNLLLLTDNISSA